MSPIDVSSIKISVQRYIFQAHTINQTRSLVIPITRLVYQLLSANRINCVPPVGRIKYKRDTLQPVSSPHRYTHLLLKILPYYYNTFKILLHLLPLPCILSIFFLFSRPWLPQLSLRRTWRTSGLLPQTTTTFWKREDATGEVREL